MPHYDYQNVAPFQNGNIPTKNPIIKICKPHCGKQEFLPFANGLYFTGVAEAGGQGCQTPTQLSEE